MGAAECRLPSYFHLAAGFIPEGMPFRRNSSVAMATRIMLPVPAAPAKYHRRELLRLLSLNINETSCERAKKCATNDEATRFAWRTQHDRHLDKA